MKTLPAAPMLKMTAKAVFGRQDFDLILCTGGNHDFELQKRSLYVESPFKNAVYLEGESYQFCGINFFGAPWIPELYGQAFYREDADLAAKWAEVPDDVDVLITHTPPANILDMSSRGLVLGCSYLREAVGRTQPIVHCFGHVHASSGTHKTGSTTYINAALVNSQYELSRLPYQLEL